jgi:outer membrane protein X
MKKIVIFALILMASFGSAMAQKQGLAIGGQVNYLTDSELTGLAFKLQYTLPHSFRLEGTAENYFKKDGLSMWGLNANIHYLIPLASVLTLYPIAGLGFTAWNTDYYDGNNGSDTTNKISVNLGAGLQLNLPNNFALDFETKYQIIDNYNQAVIGLGLMYHF